MRPLGAICRWTEEYLPQVARSRREHDRVTQTCLRTGATHGLSLPRTLDRWRKALGEGHPTVSYALSGLGWALLQQGRTGEALPLLQESLDIRSAKMDAGSTDIAFVRRDLGIFSQGWGDTTRWRSWPSWGGCGADRWRSR